RLRGRLGRGTFLDVDKQERLKVRQLHLNRRYEPGMRSRLEPRDSRFLPARSTDTEGQSERRAKGAAGSSCKLPLGIRACRLRRGPAGTPSKRELWVIRAERFSQRSSSRCTATSLGGLASRPRMI